MIGVKIKINAYCTMRERGLLSDFSYVIKALEQESVDNEKYLFNAVIVPTVRSAEIQSLSHCANCAKIMLLYSLNNRLK